MRLRIIFGVYLLLFCLAPQVAAENEVRVYTPDGQRSSNLLSIYINVEITSENSPVLKILECDRIASFSDDRSEGARSPEWKPLLIVEDVGWKETIRNVSAPMTGTLLLFDLGKEFRFPWWVSGEKIRPVLEWNTEENGRASAIGERVYLANNTGAVFWTLVGVLFAVVVLWVLAAKRKNDWHIGHALSRYVEDADGRMSLSLMQMALWTLAVGSLVLGFALVSLHVPDIPVTLVVLMGLSAGTGLIGHWQVKRELENEPPSASTPKPKRHGHFRDLINIGSADGVDRASLAKAQLFFWTLLAAGLFVFKSLQDGELWEVNEQLVALMGISQASFLGRKQVEIGRKEREAEAKKKKEGGKKPEK